MKIYAVWTTDDERRGSIKCYCQTRKKAEKELAKYRDWYTSVPPVPNNKHIIEIDVLEEDGVLISEPHYSG